MTLLGFGLLSPRPVQAAPGVQGSVPTQGFGILVATSDTTPDALVDALAGDGCGAVTIGVFLGGSFFGYIPNAPSFVNAAFPDSIAAGTGFVVRCFPIQPPPASTSPLAELPDYAVYEAHLGPCVRVFVVFPGAAFESGAGADGMLLVGVGDDERGYGAGFDTFEEAEARGLLVTDGVPADPVDQWDAEACGTTEATWPARYVGEGLATVRTTFQANGIYISDATFLSLVEEHAGVVLTDEVRLALTN